MLECHGLPLSRAWTRGAHVYLSVVTPHTLGMYVSNAGLFEGWTYAGAGRGTSCIYSEQRLRLAFRALEVQTRGGV